MTNVEFRSDAELVRQMRALLDNPIIQLAFAVMEDEAPVRSASSADVTPHYAHIQMGHEQGWAGYDSRFKSLGRYLENVIQEEKEPTYDEEQQ